MESSGRSCTSSDLYPSAYYRDAPAAIDWLCRVPGYGARGYMVADPEGHKWCFGNYRPGDYWES